MKWSVVNNKVSSFLIKAKKAGISVKKLPSEYDGYTVFELSGDLDVITDFVSQEESKKTKSDKLVDLLSESVRSELDDLHDLYDRDKIEPESIMGYAKDLLNKSPSPSEKKEILSLIQSLKDTILDREDND